MSDRAPQKVKATWFEPVVAAMLLGVSLAFNREATWHWWWLVDVTTLTGSAISSRRPVAGAILTSIGLLLWVPFTPGPASISGLGAFINVFAAFRLSHPRRFLISGVLLAMVAISMVFLSIAEDYRGDTALLLLMLSCLAITGGMAWHGIQQRIISERNERERALIDLRAELARELHDTVAQTLSSAAMRANLVTLDDEVPATARAQVDAIATECAAAAHDLRQLLSALRDRSPNHIAASGPPADADTLRLGLSTQSERLRGGGFTVETEVSVEALSPARAQTMSAIITEASNNILKHARPGSCCSLRLFETDGLIIGEFSNVPRTVARNHHSGMGLLGIEERVALLNGTCEVVRTPGRWLLRTKLPQNPASSR